MKIDHVSLTIFTWDNIPQARYHSSAFTQPVSNLGLLRLRTSDGQEGHAFLGSAGNPASIDGSGLIRWLKPILMGANPLERERLHQRSSARIATSAGAASAPPTWRCGTWWGRSPACPSTR